MSYSYSFFSPPSSLTIFFGFLTVVLGAGASAFLATGLRSPSALGRGAPGRSPFFAPALGKGFFVRFGSAGASGAGAAGAAVAPGSAARASPFGTISPLYTQTLMPITP